MKLWRQLVGNRFVRFAGIGMVCLVVIQMPLLEVLERSGVQAVLANACGFVVSTFANFMLQRAITFADRESQGWQSFAKFTGSSLLALGVNSGVFAVLSSAFGMWMLGASFVGALSGSGVNFAVNHVFTFSKKKEVPAVHIKEAVPELREVQEVVGDRSLAVFLPAYKEAENLPRVVIGLYRYLLVIGVMDFQIIIVNDGSPDDTLAVAEGLQQCYDEVKVISHEVNRGYGAALITGFHAAVDSGMDFWAFMDGDGQFSPQSFGTLLCALGDADVAVGSRIGRKEADSTFRFWLGRAWHCFGKLAVGRNYLTITDVDCGIKLGRTKKLAAFVEKLRGQGAAISPELIARANLHGQKIVEAPVTHLPREAGESTGSNLRVMLKSAWSLAKLGARLRTERISNKFNTNGGAGNVEAFAAARVSQ